MAAYMSLTMPYVVCGCVAACFAAAHQHRRVWQPEPQPPSRCLDAWEALGYYYEYYGSAPGEAHVGPWFAAIFLGLISAIAVAATHMWRRRWHSEGVRQTVGEGRPDDRGTRDHAGDVDEHHEVHEDDVIDEGVPDFWIPWCLRAQAEKASPEKALPDDVIVNDGDSVTSDVIEALAALDQEPNGSAGGPVRTSYRRVFFTERGQRVHDDRRCRSLNASLNVSEAEVCWCVTDLTERTLVSEGVVHDFWGSCACARAPITEGRSWCRICCGSELRKRIDRLTEA